MADKCGTKRPNVSDSAKLNDSGKLSKQSIDNTKTSAQSGHQNQGSATSTTRNFTDNELDAWLCELGSVSKFLIDEIRNKIRVGTVVGADSSNSRPTIPTIKSENLSNRSRSDIVVSAIKSNTVGRTCKKCTIVNENDLDFCKMCETRKNHVEMLKFELSHCHSLINELQQMVSNSGAIKYPENWSSVMDNKGVKRIKLAPRHAEYKFVIENCGSILKPLIKNIASIHRIENWAMYQVFAQKKETMIQRNGDAVTNERWLWHGSDKEALNNICHYGFNRSYAGKHGNLIGKGVYFATDFGRSLKYAQRYFLPVTVALRANESITVVPDSAYKLLLCRVLTGNYTVGSKGLIDAPPMTSGGRYDSVTDNLAVPKMFVVFQDYQAYPEYEITLRHVSTNY